MNDLISYRGLGSNLIESGKYFLNKATPMTKVRYAALVIRTAISNATGIPMSAIYSADSFHDTTDIETWKTIIENDWTNKKKWTEETFDCDNFAGSFTAYSADIYGLNSAARLTVALYNPITGKQIIDPGTKQPAYHRVAVIVDKYLDVYLLETQDDRMAKIVPGKHVVLGNWEYVPISADIN